MIFDYEPFGSFSSFEKPAYTVKFARWNTVDARGSDGLLHYGRVIDCTEEGLMLDFGTGTAWEVGFGDIYRCKLELFKDRTRQKSETWPVDVLLRLDHREPAKWYPGILITGDFSMFGSFALVRITTPDGDLVEIVPGEHVRDQPSHEELWQLLLEKGQFVKEEVILPSGVASGSPSPGPYKTPPADQHLLDRFNSNCANHWMVATHIDGSVLHVLKITDRFRRKFDRGYRSSCPKLEGETLHRMLGVTHRKRTDQGLEPETQRGPLSFSTPFDFCGGPPPMPVTAPAGEPPSGVPPFWGFGGFAMYSGVFQPKATVSTPPDQSPATFYPDGAVANGSFPGSYSMRPSFFPQYAPGGLFPQYPPGCFYPQYPPGCFYPQYPPGCFFPQYPPCGFLSPYPPSGFFPQYSPGCFFPQYPPGGVLFGHPYPLDFGEPFFPVKLPQMNKVLPKEILTEIFEYLDGVPQTQLRKVCSQWNEILTTIPSCRMFRLTEDRMNIMTRVCLLKRWTDQTKIIAYKTLFNPDSDFDTGSLDRFEEKLYHGSLMCCGWLFRCIFQAKQLPILDTLVLVDLAWHRRSYYMERWGHFSKFINHLQEELNSFASVCRRLLLKDITVVMSEDKTPVVVRITKGRIVGELSLDALWSLMDNSLPPLSAADLVSWTEWMSDNSDDDLPKQLAEILNERQSADPRDSNQFRGKEWTRDDLAGLDMDKLNRITAHSLVKTCCYEKLVLSLNW